MMVGCAVWIYSLAHSNQPFHLRNFDRVAGTKFPWKQKVLFFFASEKDIKINMNIIKYLVP